MENIAWPPGPPVPDLREDQREIAGHPARFRVVACGRRWGKTTLGLWLAGQAAAGGQRVWWVAPSYSLAFHPWRTLKEWFKDRWVSKLEAERFIELPGGGSVTVKTADNPDLLRGVGLDLVIVDEAAFVSRITWEAVLLPALSDRRGRALLISTPRGRNWFWEAFRRGQDPLLPNWQSWQHPTLDNNRIDPAEVDEMRAILPQRIFEQEYEARFLEDGGEVFRCVRQAATASPGAQPAEGHRYFVGIDFGRYNDFTAIAVIDADARPAPAMVALDRFSATAWAAQRERIKAVAKHWQAERILAEANAMGEPNIEALWQEGLPIRGFLTTARTKGPLIESLVKAIEDGELRLLPDETLIGELESYTYDVERYTGHVRYSAPPGLHDDTVIALALAWRLANAPPLALGVAEV
jgi:hypothetical protein